MTSKQLARLLIIGAGCLSLLLANPSDTRAEAGLVQLTDGELAEVSAGDFEIALEEFDVIIQENQAGLFALDIASTAFGGAEGIFTTLQAVNSAINLSVVVNIFLYGQSL